MDRLKELERIFFKATDEFFKTKTEFEETKDKHYKKLLNSHLIVLQYEIDEIIRIIRNINAKKKESVIICDISLFIIESNTAYFIKQHIN